MQTFKRISSLSSSSVSSSLPTPSSLFLSPTSAMSSSCCSAEVAIRHFPVVLLVDRISTTTSKTSLIVRRLHLPNFLECREFSSVSSGHCQRWQHHVEHHTQYHASTQQHQAQRHHLWQQKPYHQLHPDHATRNNPLYDSVSFVDTKNYDSNNLVPKHANQNHPPNASLPSRSHLRAFSSSPFRALSFAASSSPSLRAFSTSATSSPSLQQIEIQDYISSLDEGGRRILAQELQAAEEELRATAAAADAAAVEAAEAQRPTFAQLRAVCLHSMLPFVGFGFLDNALMIIAGDYIDATIGVTLGISTMAAAGFGNLFSDLAGLGCAHYIETLALMLGLRAPKLSFKQKEMSITRFAGNFGRAVGITIGCLLGMFPLLFLGGREEGNEVECERKEASGLGGGAGRAEEEGTVVVIVGESEPTVASGVEAAVMGEMVESSGGESTKVVGSVGETVGRSGEA